MSDGWKEMHDIKLSGKSIGRDTGRKEFKNRIGPRETPSFYSRFRTIAERRQTKPERSMQTRVAITVTNVPLSGAE